MTGANIFIIYTDAAGTNVTLSPRLGTGQVEPKYDSAAQVTLLAGSGVSNGVMTANVKCANCASWSGGTMDFSSSTTNWIWAEKTGDALDSDSTSEDISQHNNMGTMSFSLSEAKSSNDVNPFLSDSTTSGSASGSGASATSAAATTCVSSSATLASPTGSGCPTAWPSSYSTAWPTARPSQYSSCFASYASYYGSSYGNHAHWPTAAPYVKRDTCDDGSSSSGSSSSGTSGSSSNSQGGSSSGGSFSNNGIPFGGDSKKAAAVMMAHGITAALAFVIFFPGGGIIIRLFSFRGLVWLHAAIQALGWLIFLVAFGLGIYLAQQTHQVSPPTTFSPLHLCLPSSLSLQLLISPSAQPCPSHNRNPPLHPPLLPTTTRSSPPLPLQETPPSRLLVLRSHLARPHPHHARHHKRRPRAPTRGQRDPGTRDRVCGHRCCDLARLCGEYCGW